MKNYLKNKIKKYEKALAEIADWNSIAFQDEFGKGMIHGKLDAYKNCLKHLEFREDDCDS